VWPDLWGETSGVFTSPDVFARIAGSVPGMRDGSAEEGFAAELARRRQHRARRTIREGGELGPESAHSAIAT